VKLASNPGLIRIWARCHVGMSGLSPDAVIREFENLLREMAEENCMSAAVVAHA
jgi:hypothetical protein